MILILQIFAALFITYEAMKTLIPNKFINTFKEMGELDLSNRKVFEEYLRSRYFILFIVEIFYLLFVFSLLFTSYWYVGLLLVILTVMLKKLSAGTVFLDSVLSIIVLAIILI